MTEKTYQTPCGVIHYWTNEYVAGRDTLVFLPGLTADHRLFDQQIAYFQDHYNVFVWDAPGHMNSRPFSLDFHLSSKARWLNEIFHQENIKHPILIGQSMGGYVGQAYVQYFPHHLKGFVSIDSAPLQREFMKDWEIWMLKHTEGMYRMYPWKSLLKAGSKGTATSEYGIQLMYDMMAQYDHVYYSKLVGHGYRMLAEAIEADLPYFIDCPAMLICGEKDEAGYTAKYNKMWHEATGLPLHWIKDAGHNSNTDKPDEINALIDAFIVNECNKERMK